VKTVKDKLHEDSTKDNLIVATISKENPKVEVLEAKDYKSHQRQYDEILSAVGDYFELFKNNTNKLEDLWLQLLDFLKLKNHSQY
jgi:hypothetical protein